MSITKTASVIEYSGVYGAKIDDKNRLKIPVPIREIMRERNRYNFLDERFGIEDGQGMHLVTYRNNPFAVIKSPVPVTKETVNMGSIDELVYVAAGTIKWDVDIQPVFMFPNPDTVFLYTATDAQHMIHDDEFNELGFASRHHVGTIDKQGRIQLAHRIEDFELVMRHIADRERITNIIGQPAMFCATLTRYG